jgi:hypothetical protein
MTATDIITELERLPAPERAKVVDYLRGTATPAAADVQFIPTEEAERLGQEILRRQPEVFRRLSR